MEALQTSGEWRRFKGANVNQALEAACRELRLSTKEVTYRVVHKGKPGFLGLAAQPTELLVRPLTPHQGGEQEQSPESSPTTGRLWIDQGKLRYRAPGPRERYPTLLPSQEAVIHVDGQVIQEATPVLSESDVSIQLPEDSPPEVEIAVSVLADGYRAAITVQKKPGVRHVLKDHPPTDRLRPEVTRIEVEAPDPSQAELLDALQKHGVVYGIDRDAVQRATKSNGKPVVVAEGMPAQPSEDEDLEWLVQDDPLDVDEDICPGGIVQAGEVIAIARAGRPGTPGTTVRGETIDVPEPAPLAVDVEPSVKRDGDQFVSVQEGRACLRDGVLKVIPVRVLESLTDRANVHVDGDAFVRGDVETGTRLTAAGNIYVRGSVFGSYLVAGGHVLVGGTIVKSQVQAGGVKAMWLNRRDDASTLVQALYRITKRAAELGGETFSGAAARRLVAGTLGRTISEKARSLRRSVRTQVEAEALSGWVDALDQVESLILKARERSQLRIQSLASALKLMTRFLESSPSNASALLGTIRARACQNSDLTAADDIVLTDGGAYHCDMIAGGEIRAEGRRATARGSIMRAQNGIAVRELGSVSGTPTQAAVGEGGRITAVIAHEGTRLKIGSVKLELNETIRRLSASLDETGEINLHADQTTGGSHDQ